MGLQCSSKAAGPTNMAKSRPRASPPPRDPPAHLHSILGVTGLVHTALAHGVGADANVLTNLVAVREEDVVPMQLLQRGVGWGPGQDLATLGCVGVQLGLAAELEPHSLASWSGWCQAWGLIRACVCVKSAPGQGP